VITNMYPPEERGGYELLCQDHVRWLRAQDHEVAVMTSSEGVPPLPREGRGDCGEHIFRLLPLHWSWTDFAHRRPGPMAAAIEERRLHRAVKQLIRQFRPEVCLVWGMALVSKSPLASVHQAGIPMVAVVGESWALWDIEPDSWLKIWRQPSWRFAAPLASRLVAPISVDDAMAALTPVYASASIRNSIEESLPAWRMRGVVVANGIDLARFDNARRNDTPLRQPIQLLYAGRVERRKGLHTVLDTMSQLRQRGLSTELTVVGWREPEYAHDLVLKAEALGESSHITWRDAVPRDSMPSVYAAHDVLVFPTIWAEPFGLVALEAMAGGCVVCATGTGGSGEYLDDGVNSILSQPEDASALADGIIRLSDEPDLVAHLRAGGYATARRYSFESYAEALADIIRTATSEASSSASLLSEAGERA